MIEQARDPGELEEEREMTEETAQKQRIIPAKLIENLYLFFLIFMNAGLFDGTHYETEPASVVFYALILAFIVKRMRGRSVDMGYFSESVEWILLCILSCLPFVFFSFVNRAYDGEPRMGLFLALLIGGLFLAAMTGAAEGINKRILARKEEARRFPTEAVSVAVSVVSMVFIVVLGNIELIPLHLILGILFFIGALILFLERYNKLPLNSLAVFVLFGTLGGTLYLSKVARLELETVWEAIILLFMMLLFVIAQTIIGIMHLNVEMNKKQEGRLT